MTTSHFGSGEPPATSAEPGPAPGGDAAPRVGDLIGPLHVERIAHGGAAVTRFEGRVVFVRHALPGEQVLVRLTDTDKPSFWRGDAEQVLVTSPDRVAASCPIATQCGGCDFQHVRDVGQRQLKAAVIIEQFERLAGLDLLDPYGLANDPDTLVEPADPAHPDQLLGWRTRSRFRVSSAPDSARGEQASGRLAMRRHRSLELVELPSSGCSIAHPLINSQAVRDAAQEGAQVVDATVSDEGLTVLADGVDPQSGEVPLLHQQVNGRDYSVWANGFWQVHPLAAQVLSDAVLAGLQPTAGESALDLYCGVGLFAGQLADHRVRCVGVEANRAAVELARRNVPGARFVAAPVERSIARWQRPTDLVVLDPPRKGAGAAVCRAVAGTTPRAIAYVACDPASLARDVATFAQLGYQMSSLRAFDLFPMTHHVECVAILVPASDANSAGGRVDDPT